MEEREDTLSLLRECNQGIQMGVSAIEDVIDKIERPKLKEELESSMKEHERLGNETHDLLNELGEKVEETHPIAKEMSKMKTSVKMALDENDKPCPVPKLLLESEEEKAEWEAAKKRRDMRKKRKEEGF